MTEGFWLHSKTGRFVEVLEHAYWISEPANALKMGLSQKAVHKIGRLNPQADRIRILKAAMREGLIRVRGHGVSVSFEFTVSTILTLRVIGKFGRSVGIGDFTSIYYANIRTGERGNFI